MCIRDRILLLKLIIKIKFKRMQKANKTDVAFMKLMEDSANQECVDCRMPLLPYIRQSNILYASINNGIFICPKCSELHAPLGEDVSRIVTVSLGHIDEKEIKYFKIGGNKSFMEFMEKYELNGAATEMKYKSKAANYYRARVVCRKTLSCRRKSKEPVYPAQLPNLKREKTSCRKIAIL
eukprot:TRINITY_DN3208_c0_g3_i2.p1 TRINITY_DN3208_c0_g3~~TRINITY_DN3208_c0_g3_i2.p1  ORF type:complete len:180 (-),score=26.29 TRINITY_DN3208_c0_g3_i2:290-829(-)